jgi:hypothetical protein
MEKEDVEKVFTASALVLSSGQRLIQYRILGILEYSWPRHTQRDGGVRNNQPAAHAVASPCDVGGQTKRPTEALAGRDQVTLRAVVSHTGCAGGHSFSRNGPVLLYSTGRMET